MITANEVTSYYLYGSATKPELLKTQDIIREINASSDIDVDIAEYMSLGPGRFANPVLFEIIDKFFNSSSVDSVYIPPGEYCKKDLFDFYKVTFGGLKLQQYLFDDGKDNYVERAYIWNSTAFQIGSESKFFVGENGERWIEDFSIVPLIDPSFPENFDFTAGDGIGSIANMALEPAIDPSGIGRIVNLNFTGNDVPLQVYSHADYQISLANLVPRNEFLVANLAMEFPSFVTKLWNDGVSNTVDIDGKVIIYGTDNADNLSKNKIEALSIIDPMARYFIESGKGLTIFGGKGNDVLTGTAKSDDIYGGEGNDTLYGGGGTDQLFGGGGNDIIHAENGSTASWGGEGFDTYYIESNSQRFNQLVIDIDGRGKIIDNGIVLNGGKRIIGQLWNYGDEWGNTYFFSGSNLVINYFTSVAGWKNGDLGIYLDPVLDQLVDADLGIFNDSFKEQVTYLTSGYWSTSNATEGDDYLIAGGSSLINGGKGDDSLIGNATDNTYVFSFGSGRDFVMDPGSETSDFDTFQFTGYSSEEVKFSWSDQDLVITLSGENSVTVAKWGASQFRIEKFEFSDGVTWDADTIHAKVGVVPQDEIIIMPSSEKLLPDGPGDTQLFATGGKDVYLFDRNSGFDSIENFGKSSLDIIRVVAGISADDVVVSREGKGILFALRGTANGVLIKDWISSDQVLVEFADGTAWDIAILRSKIATLPLAGTDGDDNLIGDQGPNILQGGKGDDQLAGAGGGDIYLFERGDGRDNINESESNGEIDIIRFGAGISVVDVELLRSGDNIIFSLVGRDDRISVSNWAVQESYRIERVEFSEGTVWDRNSLAKLIAAAPIMGTDGNDSLTGDNSANTFTGGKGNDQLNGSGGGDTYVYERGDGSDDINEFGDSAETDVIRFGANITSDEVEVVRSGYNLIIRLVGTNDSITVVNWMSDTYFKIERIEFENGAAWDASMIAAKVAKLPFLGTDGNDTIFGDANANFFAGNKGNDQLSGSAGGDTYLFNRGDGNDVIDEFGATDETDSIVFGVGIAASDIRITRSGDSVIFGVAQANDSIKINHWNISAYFRIERVEFSDGTIWNDATIASKINSIPFIGSDADDILSGDAAPNIFQGGRGNDVIAGGSGADIYQFALGDGRDSLIEDGPSNEVDTIRFEGGIFARDVVFSRSGQNIVIAFVDSNDSITIQGWSSGINARVERFEFDDGEIWDYADLMKKIADLPLIGTNGDDNLIGDEGINIFRGGAGNDLLSGSTGSDLYLFDRGDGQDKISEFGYSIDDIDTVRFNGDILPSEVVFLRSGENLVFSFFGTQDRIEILNWFSSSVFRVERVEFSDGTVWNAAILMQKISALPIVGTGGNDNLSGDEYSNVIIGGSGNDQLNGNSGGDVYIVERGDGRDTINEFGSNIDIDIIRYGQGIDASDVVLSRDGNAILFSIRDAPDSITVSNWGIDSYFRIELVEFSSGSYWDATTLTEMIAALPFVGTVGDDSLTGDAGSNTFSGGKGTDQLSGLAGADTYLFNLGDGNDTINEFGVNSDIDILRFGVGINSDDIVAQRSGENMIIHFSDTDSITINYWFSDSYFRVESAEFADGTVWSVASFDTAILVGIKNEPVMV